MGHRLDLNQFTNRGPPAISGGPAEEKTELLPGNRTTWPRQARIEKLLMEYAGPKPTPPPRSMTA